MSRISRPVVVAVLVSAAFAAFAAPLQAAPRSLSPALALSSAEARTGSGFGVSSGASVTVIGSSLDPALQAVLTKERLSTDPSFVGWQRITTSAYWPTPEGTFSTDDVQSSTGSYRYQVCQYRTGKSRGFWVCSDYASMSVS